MYTSKMHIFSFDRPCEILLWHSSISAEMSTSLTLTWCTNQNAEILK